jgi:hypothetical protein
MRTTNPGGGCADRLAARAALIAVSAVIAALAGLATAAGPAHADVSNATVTAIGTPGQTYGLKCQTPHSSGVLGQYGAWGFYVDGCTVRVPCRNANNWWQGRCTARSTTTITTGYWSGDRVTMNARLRELAPTGVGNEYAVRGWSDRSCSGYNTCTTTDVREIPVVNAATVQCNGVREYRYWATNTASVTCALELTYAR